MSPPERKKGGKKRKEVGVGKALAIKLVVDTAVWDYTARICARVSMF